MAFKYFNIKLSLWLIVIFVAGVMAGMYHQMLVLCVLLLVTMMAVINVFQMLKKSHHELSFFIKAIRNNDSALRFGQATGNRSLNQLHGAFNELNELIKHAKIESRIHENYFKEIIDQLDTAIIVYNQKGFVKETNRAMLRLTGLTTLTHLVQLNRVDVSLTSRLEELKPHVPNLIPISVNGVTLELAGRSTPLTTRDEQLTIVTLHDIRSELDMKEIDAWMRLIRILNHEMMNSLTPVVSVTQSLQSMWRDASMPHCDEIRTTTINGLDAIEERSKALVTFVHSFRTLTHIPTVNKLPVNSDELCTRLNILLSPFRTHPNLMLNIVVPPTPCNVLMDEQLIIQVLINLVKNAIDATQTILHPVIEINIQSQMSKTLILVTDNGVGIASDILNDVFVPFFTTKENGSGIGLSVCKQIIRAHGGNLSVASMPGRTVFRMDV